jgi:hypothetical protein
MKTENGVHSITPDVPAQAVALTQSRDPAA